MSLKRAVLFKCWVDEEAKRVKRSVEVVLAPTKEKEELDFFYKKIECTMIEAVFAEDMQLIIDEEGMYKQKNPVFKYTFKNGQEAQLAGNMVAYKSVDNLGRSVWFDAEDVEAISDVIDMFEAGVLLGVTHA